MTLFTSLNIAKQALALNQVALNIVSSNITNMDNENYSKQRVEMVSGGTITVNGKYTTTQATAGAQIGSIARYRQAYLDNEYRSQSSDYSYYNELATQASKIETVFTGELSGGGLQDAMTDFVSACETLNSDPKNETYRTNFLQKAQILCTQFNQAATTLTNARTDLVGNTSDSSSIRQSLLYTGLTEVNSKLEQLAGINSKIIQATSNGTVSNDLLDQRDALLDDISEYIPVQVTETANSSVTLTMNGVTLVQGTHANSFDVTMGTDDTPTVVQLFDSEGNLINKNVNSAIDSGMLGAYLEMGSGTSDFSYQSVLDDLNNLANTFATAVNAVQTYDDGTNQAMAIDHDADGKAFLSDYSADGGLPEMFETSDASGTITAANIKVSADISSNYWKIATARVDTSGTWDSSSVGNAQNVKLMSSVYSKSTTSLNNMSPESFLTNMVSGIGSSIETIAFNQSSQASLYDAAGSARQSAIGVNLNEELVDLTKYQRAFQAASRIFTTTSEIMDELVNLGR